MMFFTAPVFHKISARTAALAKSRATARPPCVIHPLNVPATPGESPQDFTRYRLECLTIKTISSSRSDGTMTRRPALVVQMILEKSEDNGDGATYSLRTIASLEDLKILRHPQLDEAEAKACYYYETKLPLAQQEPIGGSKKLKPIQVAPAPDYSLIGKLHRVFA